MKKKAILIMVSFIIGMITFGCADHNKSEASTSDELKVSSEDTLLTTSLESAGITNSAGAEKVGQLLDITVDKDYNIRIAYVTDSSNKIIIDNIKNDEKVNLYLNDKDSVIVYFKDTVDIYLSEAKYRNMLSSTDTYESETYQEYKGTSYDD